MKTPAIITWEVTRKCTRSCGYCYNCSSPDTKPELSEAQLHTIVEQIIECNPLIVNITGGEPLLYGDSLFKYMKILKDNNIYVRLYTNGDQLNEANCGEVQKNCDAVVLPVTDPHNALMGPDSLENVKRATRLLKNTVIQISILYSTKNANCIEETLYVLKEFDNISNVIITPVIYSGRPEQVPLLIDRKTYDELIIRIAEIAGDENESNIQLRDDNLELRNVIKGRDIYHSVYIDCMGNVLVNQWLKISGGNVFTDSIRNIWQKNLKNIWRDNEMKSIFEGFKSLDQQEYLRFITAQEPLYVKNITGMAAYTGKDDGDENTPYICSITAG